MNELSKDPRFADSEVGRMLSQTPLGFIDIGARGDVHPLVEPIAAVTAVLGFEPDADECRRIMEAHSEPSAYAGLELEPVALGGEEGPATLHLLSVPTNHSLLPPNQGYVDRYNMVKWHEIGQVELQTTTLDSVIFGRKKQYPENFGEFLKLDTQGTEYEILEGAQRTLDERCVAVVAEVSFCKLYQGQKLFSDVETLLRRHGFAFYGFSDPHYRSKSSFDKRSSWSRERIIQADAVFLRDPLGGDPGAGQSLSPRRRAILFTVAMMLEYFDLAFELAQEYWPDNDGLQSLVKDFASLPIEIAVVDAKRLASEISAMPKKANLLVGKFVDERRHRNNYDDIADP